jgi:hypothetical protein
MAGFPVGGYDPRVYYQDDAGHVHGLAYFQRRWHHRDITGDTGAPLKLTTSALAGFPVGGTDPRVYYVDDDTRHVHELAYFQGGWHHRHVTADTSAPPAVNSALAGFPARGFDPRVYYRSDAGHVQELAYFQGGWRHYDITADTGAPPVQAGAALAAFEVGGSDPRTYYLDTAHHVQGLAYFQGGWHRRDVTADTGARRAQTATMAGFPVGGSDPRIYYKDEPSGGHVWELAYFQGGWHRRDVTADTGAPRTGSGTLVGFAVGGSDSRVYYQDNAGDVHELAYFQDVEEPPEPPGEQTRTVTLQRQDIVEGNIPYVGRFPPFGVVPRARLLRIRLPHVGLPDLALAFVKRSRSTEDCGDPNAVVLLAEGQTTTPAQLTEIYGVPQPEFSTQNPLFFVACLRLSGGPLPNFVNIEITIVLD